MDLGLNGKRALVGGGGSGIGAGIAGVLAAEGTRVVLIGRTAERLRAGAEAIGAAWVVADLATADGPAAAVAAGVEQLGGLDLLVVNSGGPPAGTFESLGEDDWLRAIDGTLQSDPAPDPRGPAAPARGQRPGHRRQPLLVRA